jgi:hypothetical protein
MRSLLLGSLWIGGAFLFPALSPGNQQPSLSLVAADNVNSRYTVESIEVAGEVQPTLTPSLRGRVASLIGSRFDPAAFDDLAREIRAQLHLQMVRPHVVRGSAPDRVRVLLETRRRTVEFDVSVPKFLYDSINGWSAQVEARTTIARDNIINAGFVSDGDALVERFTGVSAGYENLDSGTRRLHTAFLVEEYHDEWDHATVAAANPDALYRDRRNLQPQATWIVSRPLSVTAGLSFEAMDMENPKLRPENANAVLVTIRYDKSIEDAPLGQEQITATYNLRSATPALASDFRYTRQRAVVRYAVVRGRNTISDEGQAGLISGNAPLFEKFVAGNSSLLPGWSRAEIDPLGGNRLMNDFVDYSFRMNSLTAARPRSLEVFYDAGLLWNQGQTAPIRQSAGFGYRQSVFSLALAFPFRQGRVEPVVMVGMNY